MKILRILTPKFHQTRNVRKQNATSLNEECISIECVASLFQKRPRNMSPLEHASS